MFSPNDNNNLATAQTPVVTFESDTKMDPEVYIRNIQELGLIKGWDGSKTMYSFRIRMRGEAELWINSIEPAVSWEDLVNRFRERFIGKTMALTMIKELAKMKYDYRETMLGFLDRIAGMARRASLPEDVKVAMALNALPEETGKLILLNTQGKLTWNGIYYACSNIRGCRPAEITIMSAKESEKRRKSKCWLCKRYGHLIKECRFNTLAKNNKGRIGSCTQSEEGKAVGDESLNKTP
ncbi:pol polyprotein [Vairimorpha apis BRL 01]|uniref:Pol polyprotein n=1 Tax=Vairimorpha apis BRL 01 TaxID=1037528 RepID=T0LDL4_9MICR|nr:pol polyprotein [Vairimorpha apis BRL 01]